MTTKFQQIPLTIMIVSIILNMLANILLGDQIYIIVSTILSILQAIIIIKTDIYPSPKFQIDNTIIKFLISLSSFIFKFVFAILKGTLDIKVAILLSSSVFIWSAYISAKYV